MTNWFIKNRKEDINKVATDNNISKVLAKLLINRGISNKSEIKEFLNPDINKMHSPNLLDDLNAATSIIKNRVEKNF